LGEYLSFTALFLIYRWKAFPVNPATGRKISKLVTIPVSLISLAGIYTTMFRNIWGGFVGGYALRHLMTRKGRIFLFVATISGLIGFSVFSSQITSSSVYQERLTNVENIHDRLNAWLYAFRAFSEHPLLGIGYGQLKHYIRGAQARGDDLRIYEEVAATYHPHNTVIGMLGENGIIITLLFLLILWRFLPYVRNALRQAYLPEDKEFGLFALSATFALLAPHMTDRCLQWTKYNNLLFLFFALVVARSTEISRRAEEPNSIIDSSEIDSESEPNPLTIEHVS
jgi:O-antigen ligase